jgi:hypothetical protein
MLHQQYVQNQKNVITEVDETFEPNFVQEGQNCALIQSSYITTYLQKGKISCHS